MTECSMSAHLVNQLSQNLKPDFWFCFLWILFTNPDFFSEKVWLGLGCRCHNNRCIMFVCYKKQSWSIILFIWYRRIILWVCWLSIDTSAVSMGVIRPIRRVIFCSPMNNKFIMYCSCVNTIVTSFLCNKHLHNQGGGVRNKSANVKIVNYSSNVNITLHVI